MKSSEEKRIYWEKHLVAWEESGLTQIAYCRQAGVAYATFKKWRRQLQDKPNTKSPQFVEAKPACSEKASSNNALILQISLPNGSRIAVGAETSYKVAYFG